jgi:hypothetical protein
MADAPPGRLRAISVHSIAGDHPELPTTPVFAAPRTKSEANRVRSRLLPRGCFKLEDTVFAFDSSFPVLEDTFDAAELKELLEERPGSLVSVFGHADPTGDDDYNKVLSGRRAQAIFAMLVRDVEKWKELYNKHDQHGRDRWGLRSVQVMLNAVGAADDEPEGAPIRTDGELDDPTRERLRRFQVNRVGAVAPFGPAPEHRVDPRTFAVLAGKYMDVLCRVDGAGGTLRLTLDDFLGGGKDPNGKADCQGCSEFNPTLVFSKEEDRELQRPESRERRNRANRPNRRVLVLVFRPGSRVDPKRWPCPSVKEGVAGCRKRFFKAVAGTAFADGDARRAPQAERREFEKSGDTFACRFYDRLVTGSPCEIITLTAFGTWEVEPVVPVPGESEEVELPPDPKPPVPRIVEPTGI